MNEDIRLIEPFPTNDLQFALGVEWEMFRQQLKTGKPIKTLVTLSGLPGILAMCARHKRYYDTVALDGVTDWVEIIVTAVK